MGIHKNRTVSTFLAIIIMITFVLGGSSQIQAVQDGDYIVDGDYKYIVTDGKAEIVAYIGSGGDVAIPNTLGRYSVTSICGYAFSGCTGLTSITIPQGVTSIGAGAFTGCTGLTGITIPQGVTSIGTGAFSGCTGLTGITIPQGVTSIGSMTFYSCTDLTSISIPQGVTSIGEYAFYHCSGLTSITIPQGVTTIGSDAFWNCTGLSSINIPQGLTSIGDYAFYLCSALTSITIPQGVTSIGADAFSGCTGLTSITITQGVTSISDDAFSGCTGLTSITIPLGVTSIGGYAFSGCTGLTGITIPQGVTSIGNNAFYGCTGLTSITIPESVTSIGNYAFAGCKGLTNITIPESITSISNDAFYGCTGLTSITIPESVTSIGNYAFSGCTGLTGITIPQGITSIGVDTFSGCTGLTNITIPQGVTSICGRAFYGCSGLTSIIIPQGVTSIDFLSFSGCTLLGSITFNSATTSIYNSAATIPQTTKIIGYNPSTAKSYAAKYNRRFLGIGSPTASNVKITGTAKVGQTLIGSYQYSDLENDAEGVSTFKWYRCSKEDSAPLYVITGANGKSYKLVPADQGKIIYFEVTPVASTGSLQGAAVLSAPSKPVGEAIKVTAAVFLENKNVGIDATLAELDLPETVSINLSDGSNVSVPVNWDSGTPAYNGNQAGTYTFTGSIGLPEGVINPDNIKATVKVVVAAKDKDFSDVSSSFWGYDAIHSLSRRGIVSGYLNGTFKPDASITRAEFATMLVKALGLTSGTTGTFNDVTLDAWYFGAVSAAASAGLVSGMGNNLFAPNALITREQMAVMVAHALGNKAPGTDGTELNAFSDKSAVSSWAVSGMGIALKSGIVHGMTASTIVPLNNATRAQAAVMIYNMLSILGK